MSSVISDRNFGIDKQLKALKASEKLICEKIEKEIKNAISGVIKTDEHNQIQISEEYLFKILDVMNFLNTRLSSDKEPSKQLVTQIYKLFGSPLTYHDLKLLVFTAYNIWQPSWMSNVHSQLPLIDEDQSFIPQEVTTKNFHFKSRDDFEMMHKKVMILIANRGQNEHAQKVREHEERA